MIDCKNKMGKKTGSTGRFGVRYGKTVKQKVLNIEKKQRKKQTCPYCRRQTAKRVSVGVYKCSKCGSKFTGKAYSV